MGVPQHMSLDKNTSGRYPDTFLREPLETHRFLFVGIVEKKRILSALQHTVLHTHLDHYPKEGFH